MTDTSAEKNNIPAFKGRIKSLCLEKNFNDDVGENVFSLIIELSDEGEIK